MNFLPLPLSENGKGEERKVGYEIEYGNVDVSTTASLIQKLYGGDILPKHRFFHKVENTRLGDFTVTIDLSWLSEKKYNNLFARLNLDLNTLSIGDVAVAKEVEDLMENIAVKVVPYEIVAPPIAVSRLPELEELRFMLYEQAAEGTRSFLTNAFGTHINVEIPDEEPSTLVNYLRAFILLYPWIVREADIDLARSLTKFINPFPEKYGIMIMDENYHPDLKNLILDYNEHNPSRDRPLDMYPVFKYLNHEYTDQFEGTGQINPRPTFHYRLPNSLVGQSDWSLAREWNTWIVVERLVQSDQLMKRWMKEYTNQFHPLKFNFKKQWLEHTHKTITNELVG